MKNNDKKTRYGTLFACLAFLIVSALGVFMFCRGQFEPLDDSNVYVFDGWVYGREDQKKACAALAAAGLDDYAWEAGKLSVPTRSKNAYQSVLSNAGAYPKAPSEMRGEALRQMSPFESDSKTKMREVDACALQLERMIEQMRGVEYATVGVRARKEVVGLSAKNIVTASVGVATKNGFELDSDALTAITITTQRLLGIEDGKDVAILDLKEGKSYLGVENSDVQRVDLALESEREWTEKYWRNKYLEAFSDVENIRVTVDVELVRTSDKTSLNDVDATTKKEAEDIAQAFVKTEDRRPSVLSENRVKTDSLRNFSEGSPFSSSPVISCGFAQLGNPNASRSKNARKRQASIWAVGDGRRQIGANENVVSGSLSNLLNSVSLTSPRIISSPAPDANYGVGYGAKNAPFLFDDAPRLIEVSVSSSEAIPHVVPLGAESVYCSSDDIERFSSTPVESERILQTSSIETKAADESAASPNGLFEMRSIIVHIWLPRTYVSRAVSRYLGQETFADSSEGVREMLERQMLEETKRNATSIFRPTSERLGWTEETLANSFVVDVYSDAGLTDDSVESGSQEVRTSAKFGSFSLSGSTYPGSEIGTTQEDNSFDQNWSAAPKDDENSPETSDDVIGIDVDNNRYGAIASTSGKIADISTSVEESEKEFEQLEREYVVQLKSLADKILDVNWQEQKRVLATGVACIVGFVILAGITRVLFSRKIKKVGVENNVKIQRRFKAGKRSRESRQSISSKSHDRRFSLSESDEEFDDELEAELERLAVESKRKHEGETSSKSVNQKNELEDFSDKRRKALELISRYPERAAASLQGWVKGSSL
ncbi:MAG: hypothetical protein J6X44_04575 [Thermoguttaceae bacterium]|nr:hypothetical protein [Thermoguttaceae bacterium]